ncbi:MAG: oligosaccharide flippase family protein, partial [Candidatus Promineifilaceae bacterium]|nr:oligosaccharide flippase family protein [Candidatus Promineifilaceae bacterium]
MELNSQRDKGMVNAEPQSRFHLMDIKQILTGDDAEGGLRNYLIWGTAGVFFLQVFATGLGFVTNVLLARLLGATEYGVYTYVFAWVGLLTVLSMFGFGRLLVREIASYITNTRWGLIHGIIRYVATRSFLISIGVAIIAGLLTWLFKENLNPRMFPAFWIAMIALPFLTLTLLNEQALQGFKKVVLGRIPQVFVRTPLFICSLLLVYWLYPQDLDAVIAIGLQASAISVGFLVGVWLLYLITRKQV